MNPSTPSLFLIHSQMTTENLVMEDHPDNSASENNEEIVCGTKRKIDDEYDRILSNERYHRLSTLLTQTTLYSKFLADRLVQPASSSQQQPTSTRNIPQPALLTGLTLRDYQLAGMSWLISLFENGLNGILADEMGLGKTIEAIAFLAFLIEKGIKGPFLIVGPLSTLSNWVREITRCCPKFSAVMYHGNVDERAVIRKTQLSRPHQVSSFLPYPIVVTSYELIINDKRYLGKFDWKYIIVDEGHRLKNLDCKLIRKLKEYSSQNRLLLTGTPLQNNLTELWSLLNFLLPDIFDDLHTFHSWFNELEAGDVEDIEHNLGIVNTLHVILKPFLLRRLKSDVEAKIPPKKEFLIKASLTSVQRSIYEKLLTIGFIREKSSENDNLKMHDEEIVITTSTFQNVLMQLRKVCNHPYLLECPVDSNEDPVIDERIVSWSGKMVILDQLLHSLSRSKHKTLIFSQFTTMLDILESYLEMRKFKYFRIDGRVKQHERAEQIETFNNSSEFAVFLLSTRAGGLGINLTTADTVIIYDSDWNPQMDIQAQDRCHRIGQKKPVTVIRMVTADSVEMKILQRAEDKRNLERIVIYKESFKTFLSQDLIMDDLTNLLEVRKNQPKNYIFNRRDKGLLSDLNASTVNLCTDSLKNATEAFGLNSSDLAVIEDRTALEDGKCPYTSERIEPIKSEIKVVF